MNVFLKSMVLVALLASAAVVPAHAGTPDDQLVVATTMNNILTLDPAGITGRETVQVLNNIYDTLVILDPKDRSLRPRLAERWEISADRMTVRFYLRPDARFSSGNPVTAEDVKWSLTRLLALNLAQASALKTRGFKAGNAEKLFVAEGPHTFILHLPQPDDPTLVMMILAQNGFGTILDKQTVLKHEVAGDWGAAWLRTNAAGSGPYVLSAWASNEYVIMTRNPAFWGPKPAMRRILFRHLPESQTQRLMLEKGDIDVAYSMQSPDLRALESDPDIEIETAYGSGFYYLAASMKDERFKDPRVLRALRHLIDYEGVNRAVMPYFGTLRQRPISTGIIGSLPDPGYKLDIARARALLAEAGYSNGMDVTLRFLSEEPFSKAATAIQNTLEQGGFRVRMISGSGDTIYGAMRDRNFELLIGRGGGGQQPHPDNNLRALAYNPDNSDKAKLTNYQGWRASYYDPELNRKVESALLEADPARQKAAYEDIQTYIDAHPMPIQPFSEVLDTAAFRKTVHGVVASPWLSRFEWVSKS
ncbi:ABC transporter substrate-binding protein [Phyllobacterium leguminum]|uniref:Peptide/nickel transport system substrate-binding protein n=1 Tax=Phyllobacterium leguminum TaxID=314237 RepID=A0A318T2Y5_9HYPH|nr:ABC transporter substrate-binding protein [Phyllobacterium leguminum]PYE87009.1 peptide/nickel transport system substrate-binding protein [Phyllobacterium leguminum]